MSGVDFSNSRMFLDVVSDVAGQAGINALHHELGGRHVHVPCKFPHAASPIVRVLGMEVAQAVTSRLRVIDAAGCVLGGFQVYINKSGRNLKASKRDAAIRAGAVRAARAGRTRAAAVDAVAGGMTRQQAARHCGIAIRTVYRALSEHRLQRHP